MKRSTVSITRNSTMVELEFSELLVGTYFLRDPDYLKELLLKVNGCQAVFLATGLVITLPRTCDVIVVTVNIDYTY